MGKIIFSLVVVLMLVMMALFAACSCGLSPNLSPDVAQPSGWPTTWTGLSTDPAEGGGKAHRDVTDTNGDGYALYYASDSQYLYLRMETVTSPGWNSTKPADEARYKWWFDTAGTTAEVDGTTVKGAEFLLILEDLTDNSNDPDLIKDRLGELTHMDDLNNDGFQARWDSKHPPNYTFNNAQKAPTGPSSWWRRELGTGTPGVGGPQGVMGADIGYRIDNATTGGNFVDMYVSWAAIGNPSSLCLIWATDNIDPNLDQAPNLDRPEETTCLSVCVPPVAAFNATPTSGCAPLPVNFTDNSTGNPTSWSWDVDGDGTEDYNTQNPSHIYNTPGLYTVSLMVTNACGSDTETKADYIVVDPLPDANFQASDTNPCVNEEIDFTNTSTGGPTSWSWDVDNDGTEDYNTQNPSHTYTSAGTYTVSLTVTNGCGPDTETKADYIVVDPLPDANFQASDTSPCVNEEIDFTDTSSGSPTSWSWDVDGDGTKDYNTQNPSHTYTSAGTYTVSLTVTNGCGPDTETKADYIVVDPLPDADLLASETSPCVNEEIDFTDTSSGSPTIWSWDVDGDGTEDYNTQNPSHTYTSDGTYTVRLTVTNACGPDTETKSGYIEVGGPPIAEFSGSPRSGCAPLTVEFVDLSTRDPTSWSWTFTGGSPPSATGKGPHTVTYNSPGTYTVSLTVSNNCGSGTETKINYITVHAKPTADAGADTGITGGGSVVIGSSPTASGGTAPYTYSWTPTTNLNDADIANPTASPSVTTTYTVTVTDSKGCTDSDDVTVTFDPGCCICGFVYRAGTTEGLAGWEVILEKKTNSWDEVQRTITDADGKYCFCGLGDGEYRVSEVVKSGWNQVSPLPNEHLVILPGDCCDPEYGPFLNFENEQSPKDPSPTVGWEASPIDKLAVLAPWIALFAVIVAAASLLVLRRRRTQS